MNPASRPVENLEKDPAREPLQMRGFCLTRDTHGTLALRFGSFTVPVNTLYVEQILVERGSVVKPNETWPVGADFVKDALEEALGYLGHELRSLEAMKREVLRYCVIADEIASQPSKAVA